MGPLLLTLLMLALAMGCFWLARKAQRDVNKLVGNVEAIAAKVDAGEGTSRLQRDDLKLLLEKNKKILRETRWIKRGALAGTTLFLAILAAMSIVVTPTRNVAVTDAFGRPTDTLSNGLSIIFPWESVTTYDATIQTLEMNGDDKDGKPRQNVRIMGGTATAGMDVIVEWRIDPSVDIQTLHKEWRNFESLETRVVKPRLTAALNAVFEKFDPLVAQREKGATPVSMSVFEDNLRIELQGALPKEILVRKTMIAFVQYPPNVQKALDDMQVELANTQIALQQQETAEAQKAAIETLASAKMSPDAIVQYCLVVTERLAQAGKAISAAWNCMGTVPVTVGVTK